MAHEVNYAMKDYDRIYADVRGLLSGDDLSFGNMEMPVTDSLPLSTYPRFNVHTPYLAAAVHGGFDVFSLANNHSNDQGAAGIAGTLAAFAAMEKVFPSVRHSGLKRAAADSLEPVLIEKNGWSILFLSVTEILNSYDSAGKLVYYVAPTAASRDAFAARLVELRLAHPCDLFVLSIHSNEPEYVREASVKKKEWFARLAASGVDIVWGHHPHVMQGWELRTVLSESDSTPDAGTRQALCMYSMGNFISGQRYRPERENPEGSREYTGDAVLLRVRASEASRGGPLTLAVEPVPVTNYTDPASGVIVRQFTSPFIESLPAPWRGYYTERYRLMTSYLPLLPEPPGKAILLE
jgi:poly-gamma-glutamate synthesis protein (capsule biosynthesis protein)